MVAYTVRADAPRGALVTPQAVKPEMADLVRRIQRLPWPQWNEPGDRMRREVIDLCQWQAARGLTVLSWLADGGAPCDACEESGRLLTTTRLTGASRQELYAAAERLARPVRDLVIANFTWVLSSAHGGRVTAPFFAGHAYPDDGYAAAHATMTLTRMWERAPDVRQALAAAWAATRTPADWCRAAELQARYGGEVPVSTYPRGPFPVESATRPWITRLLGCE
jgi:hypothetical protein